MNDNDMVESHDNFRFCEKHTKKKIIELMQWARRDEREKIMETKIAMSDFPDKKQAHELGKLEAQFENNIMCRICKEPMRKSKFSHAWWCKDCKEKAVIEYSKTPIVKINNCPKCGNKKLNQHFGIYACNKCGWYS